MNEYFYDLAKLKANSKLKEDRFAMVIKKYIILFIECVIISFFLESLIVFAQPKPVCKTYNIEEGKSVLTNEYELSLVGYEQTGMHYVCLDGDPQFYINNVNQSVQSIEIQFLECDAKNPGINVYYPTADGVVGEHRMKYFTYYELEKKAVVEIPNDYYEFIRLDINTDFVLADIKISSQPLAVAFDEKKADFDISLYRIAVIFLITFLFSCYCSHKNIKVFMVMRTFFNWLLRVFKSNLLYFGIYAALFLLAVKILPIHRYKLGFAFAVLIIVHVFVAKKASTEKKPENLFIIICLLAGLLLSVAMPKTLWVTWDDESHFPRAVVVSHLGTPKITRAESNLTFYGRYQLSFEKEIVNQQTAELDALYEEGSVSDDFFAGVGLYQSLSYLPNAIGLFIGRLLHLSFHQIFVLGRVSGLLFYAVIVYFAIKITPIGKMIMLVIALLPTSVILASSYSYDPWLIALTMLWVAMLLDECKKKERPLTLKKMLLMLSLYGLACSAKAIYCVLGFAFLLLPQEKFISKKERKNFCILFSILFVMIVASFICPLIFNTSSFSDFRGGGGVNASEQIKFILSNPFSYLIILFKHICAYISLENSENYITLFGYLGSAKYHLVFIVLLTAVIITDRNENDVALVDNWKNRIIILGLILCAICLISTALYISFTPVAATWIGGVQARYLIPLLFPTFAFMGTGKIQINLKSGVYNLIIACLSSFLLFSAVWDTCISKYV